MTKRLMKITFGTISLLVLFAAVIFLSAFRIQTYYQCISIAGTAMAWPSVKAEITLSRLDIDKETDIHKLRIQYHIRLETVVSDLAKGRFDVEVEQKINQYINKTLVSGIHGSREDLVQELVIVRNEHPCGNTGKRNFLNDDEKADYISRYKVGDYVDIFFDPSNFQSILEPIDISSYKEGIYFEMAKVFAVLFISGLFLSKGRHTRADSKF